MKNAKQIYDVGLGQATMVITLFVCFFLSATMATADPSIVHFDEASLDTIEAASSQLLDEYRVKRNVRHSLAWLRPSFPWYRYTWTDLTPTAAKYL